MSIYDQKHPTVDIVVLVFNNYKILPRFFKHIYSNTSKFNLIFVDNNSTDKSVEYIKLQQKKKNNINLIKNSSNLGVAAGRNIGAKNCNEELIINLDTDQMVNFGWLQELVAIMEKGFDFVGVEGWVLNGPDHPILPYFPSKRLENPFRKATYVGAGGCLMKKSVFERLGYYDEQFSKMYFEDPDLIFSALKNGHKVAWNYKNKIVHLGKQTKTNFQRQQQFKQSYERFKKKWHPYLPPPINMLYLSKFIDQFG